MIRTLASRRAAAVAYARLERAEDLRAQKRITEVQLLAASARAEVASWSATPIFVKVVGARVVLTWIAKQAETERIVARFWRAGWNVPPPLRRLRGGRVGLYLRPGHPLVYLLALLVSNHLDGSTTVLRTGLRTAQVNYGSGVVDVEIGEDNQRVSVVHACERTGKPEITRITLPTESRDAFDRALYVFFRGGR